MSHLRLPIVVAVAVSLLAGSAVTAVAAPVVAPIAATADQPSAPVSVASGPRRTAASIAVGSGRVVFADDDTTAGGSGTTWARSVEAGDGTIAVGVKQDLGTSPTADGLAVSGLRTVFWTETPQLVVLTQGEGDSVVPTAAAQLPDAVTLNGTRLLVQHAAAPCAAPRSDVTCVGWTYRDLGALNYSREVGPLEVDPASGIVPRIAIAADTLVTSSVAEGVQVADVNGGLGSFRTVPDTIGLHVSELAMAGRYAVWNDVTTAADGSQSSRVELYGLFDGSRATVLTASLDADGAGSTDRVVGLSASYVLYEHRVVTAGTSTCSVVAHRLADGAEFVPAVPCDASSHHTHLALSGTTVGAITAKGVPEVVGLPGGPERPWDLHGGRNGPAFHVGGVWILELPMTAPLTACGVDVTGGRPGLVRHLTCDPAAMELGVLLVRWDGRDTAGAAVPAGRYLWTRTAGNDKGSVLNVFGDPQGSEGNVDVLPPVPGAYVPVTPFRALDTRTGSAPARVAAGRTVTVPLAGRGGLPGGLAMSGAALTVTAVGATASGYVTAYAAGTTRPLASSLNYAAGETVANAVTIGLTTDGALVLFNGGGRAVDLVVDVSGYFVRGNVDYAGGFVAVAPARVLDTRRGLGAAQRQVAAGYDLPVTVSGRGGVPPANASAVVLNVTATGATASGYITAYASDATQRPVVSTVQYRAGAAAAGQVIVPIPHDGRIVLFNGGGRAVDLVADVSGYYTSGTPTNPGMFVALNPVRMTDTRSGLGLPSPGGVSGYSTLIAPLGGRSPLPTIVGAVVATVTVAGTSAPGYITAYATRVAPRPVVSTLNYARGRPASDMATVPIGLDGRMSLYNGGRAAVDVIVDVAGYYLG